MAEEEMADGLSTINVDQLSRDVNALVQAAADIEPQYEGHDQADASSGCCQPSASGKDDGISQLYFSNSYVERTCTEEGENLNHSHQSTKHHHHHNSDKLIQHLNKGTVYLIPNHFSSSSTTSGTFLPHGSNQTSHFQPILPATLAPSVSNSRTRSTSHDQSRTALGDAGDLGTDVTFDSSERNSQYCGPSTSHSAAGIVSADLDVSNFQSNVGLHIAEVERQGSDQSAIQSQVPCDEQRQRLTSLNPHTQLDIQVPPNIQSQLLSTFGSQPAQSLLNQLALFSPGNQDGGTAASHQQQSSQLQSLLSPHSQSALLPYLLRTMASPGQLNSNSMDLNLLTDSTPSCNQTQEVNSDLNLPQPSQEMSFQDQEMQSDLPPVARSSSGGLQAYSKSLKQSQVLGLDLAVQGNSGMEAVQELSTIAPSIITSSIHSLCLPAPGVNTNALNAVNLTSGLNCHVNVLAPSLAQNGSQLSHLMTSAARSSGNAPSDVDLQSLAMQISEIRNSESRINTEYQLESQDGASEENYCIQCDKPMSQVCPQHGPPRIIADTVIQKRAQITLPSCLCLKKSNVSKNFMGVWARETLKVGCRFGPLEGMHLKKLPPEVDSLSPLLWKVFQHGKVKHYIDVKNEDVSNWMMYVKRARKLEEQNLSAHQINGKVYFTSRRDIQVGEELLLWYNKEYAKLCGATLIPEDSFKCNLCGRQFSYQQELEGHVKYRHPSPSERNFICKVCSKAFKTSTKLKVHSLKHSGDRPFPCKICHKSFTDNSNLRRHARIHSGEKKFECSLCGMLFRQKAHLVTHTVTHTGEKKLKCQYCGKSYSRKADLWQHLMYHSQDKKHTCSVCSRSFLRSQHLKNHMVTHTKQQNHSCSYCKKTYQTLAHLQRHETSCSKRYGTTLARVSQG